MSDWERLDIMFVPVDICVLEMGESEREIDGNRS